MEPGVSVSDEPAHSDVADPVAVGGSVLLAILVALLLAIVVQRTIPRGAPRPAIPSDELPTEEAAPLDVADRTTEIPHDKVPVPGVGVYALFQQALGRSRELLQDGLDRIFGRPIDATSFEELEEALLRADVGVKTTEQLIQRVREESVNGSVEPEVVRATLKSEMKVLLEGGHAALCPGPDLWVVLVVGVNGSGKTTTIGKLAARLKGEGRKVLLAAGDTYRAAAEQQLGVWAERAGVDIVALDEGADPAAVAFKAVERARAEGHDVVIVDTAGRLQTRKPLMEQLSKIRRVLDRAAPGAPHETLLVLDGTMGQNALSQARLFHEATPITGVVVTKLDGTAKGGMILAISTELGLPIKLVGLGEKVGDLRDFDPVAFVDALV